MVSNKCRTILETKQKISTEWLDRVANTKRVLNARQYSATRSGSECVFYSGCNGFQVSVWFVTAVWSVQWMMGNAVQCDVWVNMMERRPLVAVGRKATSQIRDIIKLNNMYNNIFFIILKYEQYLDTYVFNIHFVIYCHYSTAGTVEVGCPSPASFSYKETAVGSYIDTVSPRCNK